MTTFDALRHQHYRTLWAGQGMSGLGFGMQMLATGWLVVLLAERDGHAELGPLYLGLMGLARAVPAIGLGLIGGVVADWFDRRTLLWGSRLVQSANAALIATLIFSGHVNIAVLMGVTMVGAVANSFSGPAQQAMLSGVVPQDALMSAVSLNYGTMQTAQLVGPLVAGLIIIPLGVGGVFAANAIVFLAALGLMTGLPPSPPEVLPTKPRSVTGALSSLAEGLRYAASDPATRWLLIASSVAGVAARPLQQMLPAVAHDVLSVGATELSLLLAAQSVGSIAGTAFSASLGSTRRRGLVVSAAIVAWGVMTSAFAVQHELLPAMLIIFAVGFPNWVFSSTLMVVLQTRTPDQFRGRIMSVQILAANGLQQMGTLAIGALATFIGVGNAIGLGGILLALFGLTVFLRVDAIRGLGNERAAPATRGAF